MHNIYELEKRWRSYKIRKYLPHVGAAITALFLLTYVFITISTPKTIEVQDVIEEKNIEYLTIDEEKSKKELIQTKEVIKEVIKEEINNENKTLMLNPSLDFIKNLQSNSITNYEPKAEKIKSYQTQNLNSIEKNTEIQDIKEQDEKFETKKKVATFSFVKQETVDDLNHVIKRFKKNNNPALGLFIAKKYYKLKDYHKAYNYALITNEINKDIDESWIIFSKSLVKLGKKEMAIKTLSKYIEQSSSINAKVLLENIKTGKFK